jgi:hypothetical protein
MDYGIKVRDMVGHALVGLAIGILTDVIALVIGTIKQEHWSKDWPFGMLVLALMPQAIFLPMLGLCACFRIRPTKSAVEYVFLGRFVLKRYPLSQFDSVHSVGGFAAGGSVLFTEGRTIPIPPMVSPEIARLARDLATLQEQARKEAATGCARPLRPVVINPQWLEWNNGLISRLAQAIREDRAFDRLPILGDALEEAGCTDEEVLGHCRRPGEHLADCWILSWIVGEEKGDESPTGNAS